MQEKCKNLGWWEDGFKGVTATARGWRSKKVRGRNEDSNASETILW